SQNRTWADPLKAEVKASKDGSCLEQGPVKRNIRRAADACRSGSRHPASRTSENRPPNCCETSGFRAMPEGSERPYFFYARRIGFVIRWPAREHLHRLFLGSSAVEHPTVNRMVAGSNPARGASSFSRQPFCLSSPAHGSSSPRRDLRPDDAFIRRSLEQRAQGMPGARRTHCLACKRKRRTQANTGTPKSLRHSLRNGITAAPCSPRSTGLVSLRHERISAFRPQGRNRISTHSTPASGGQDHTA